MDFKITIDNEIIREGKTIINFIDESIQINKYGLYSNYYVENDINYDYTSLYDMVSKPLEYKDQYDQYYIYSIFDEISCGLFNNLKIFNIGKLINNKTITYENWKTITIKQILNKDTTTPNYLKIMENLKSIINESRILTNYDYIINCSIYDFLEFYLKELFDINDDDYFFISHLNGIKPIINELLREEYHINEVTLKGAHQSDIGEQIKKKYIKYKEKYIKLKNKNFQ